VRCEARAAIEGATGSGALGGRTGGLAGEGYDERNDDAFTMAPGEERVIALGEQRPERVELSSLNGRDPAPVDWMP
jgi:hypothetical protein